MNSKMERKSGDIYVEDVYELAADIGDEFQKLIESLGSDSIKFLMPKVIRVLEHLEMLAILKEDFDSKLDSLKQNLLELENDKRERTLNQNKYELEMESIEENWRKENLLLTQTVNQLRHQNLKLSNTVDNEKSLSQSLTDLQKRGQIEIDSEINSLKESIRRSEHKIDSITKEMDSKNQEIEKLSSQLEEVMQQNRDLRRRVKHTKHLWSESIADHNIKDIGVKEHNISNVICDKSDGQKLFSLSEIRSILLERNYLKSRLNDLEEEFSRFKSLSVNSSTESETILTNVTKDESDSDDLPVEGPINREPEDKLFPQKQQNKILRFFPSIIWPRIKRP